MSTDPLTPMPAPAQGSPIARALVLVYGTLTYLGFLATFLYLIGWTGNLIVPRSIDAVNVAILALFAVQHSVMARAAFKRWWTRFVPEPIERSTYVLFTVAILILLIVEWRSLPDVVWQLESGALKAAVWALFGVGWGVVLFSTFIIDHFDLFGLKQVIFYARGRAYPSAEFKEVALYRYVRHPLMLGFLVAFWSAPVMTQGHLLFSAVITAYVLIAIQIEERELISSHGEDHEQYRRRVPMLLPTLRRKT